MQKLWQNHQRSFPKWILASIECLAWHVWLPRSHSQGFWAVELNLFSGYIEFRVLYLISGCTDSRLCCCFQTVLISGYVVVFRVYWFQAILLFSVCTDSRLCCSFQAMLLFSGYTDLRPCCCFQAMLLFSGCTDFRLCCCFQAVLISGYVVVFRLSVGSAPPTFRPSRLQRDATEAAPDVDSHQTGEGIWTHG